MIEQLFALLANEQPIFFLLAGPNGAGKSTFRKSFLDPNDFPCFDPDQNAREVLGRDPKSREEALRTTSNLSAEAVTRFETKASFGLETVFSDQEGHKLGLLRKAREQGYHCGVIFIGLDEPQLAIARVVDRVNEGGHDVPDDLIIRRFPLAISNLSSALSFVDFALFVDNSGRTRHRAFGMFTREGGLQLWDRVPRWFQDVVVPSRR